MFGGAGFFLGTDAIDLRAGLVAFWRLDETSGDRLDASGNGHTLTPAGTVGSAAGVIGNAATIDGTEFNYLAGSAVVTFGGSSSPTSPISMSIWVYPAGVDLQPCFNQGTGPATPGQMLGIGDGYASFTVDANTHSASGGSSAVAGAWNHIVGTFDGTTVRVYVNGTLDAEATSPADYSESNGIYLGDTISSNAQRLDLAGVWSRALSPAEVAQLYNGGAGYDPTA
jgi:hypothetical protein